MSITYFNSMALYIKSEIEKRKKWKRNEHQFGLKHLKEKRYQYPSLSFY